jgi:hypothetical protein
VVVGGRVWGLTWREYVRYLDVYEFRHYIEHFGI